MPPHTIRLRGFWTRTEIEPGRGRHARNFGRPRTLAAGETAWLVGTAAGTVWLNGELLGTTAGPFAFDVTARLLTRNTVEVEPDPPTDLALEIRA